MAHQIWTIGHSTRTEQELIKLLKINGIGLLADVRAFPASRRYPQFNKDRLSASLLEQEIVYRHLPLLGGRRSPQRNSKNVAWKNASFRAYADYMESADFKQGIKELLDIAASSFCAVMCAEALWWRCHRSLIADYLKSMGWAVVHILDENKTELHPYTSAASIIDGRLTYAGVLDSSDLK